jgi:hypothetical protein
MKQKPPTFEQEYSEHSWQDSHVYEGFIPYKRNEEYIHSLLVEMIADKWRHGAMLVLNVYECVNNNKKINPLLTKVVYTNYYSSESSLERIIPTPTQERLINALSSGDLRGRYAEDIAFSLYIDLFVLNPKSGFKDILPKVVEKYMKKDIQS